MLRYVGIYCDILWYTVTYWGYTGDKVTMIINPSSRLRDLSAQDKFEHQRVVKDLERISGEANHLREQKEKLEQDVQVWVQSVSERKTL